LTSTTSTDTSKACAADSIADEGRPEGTTIGINATTLEANAALRSIVRRDTGESYQGFSTALFGAPLRVPRIEPRKH
jgi:hypothetical protein